MTGSEKQIKWAEEIRKYALEEITEETAIAYAEKEGEEISLDLLREYRRKIETCEDSKYFIHVVRHHIELFSNETAFCWMRIEEDYEEWEEYAREALAL